MDVTTFKKKKPRLFKPEKQRSQREYKNYYKRQLGQLGTMLFWYFGKPAKMILISSSAGLQLPSPAKRGRCGAEGV